MSVQPIITILEKLEKMHKSLLEHAYRKTELVKNNDMDELDQMLKIEQSHVAAIEQSTGELLWEKEFESPSHGPNGLAVDEGMVFGATAEEAFGLDAETGEESFGCGSCSKCAHKLSPACSG